MKRCFMTKCYSSIRYVNLDADLTTSIKINSKLITGLNVKHEAIKLPEDNTGGNADDPGTIITFQTQRRRHDP